MNLLDELKEMLLRARELAARVRASEGGWSALSGEDAQTIRNAACVLEMGVYDIMLEEAAGDGTRRDELMRRAAEAFQLLRLQPSPDDPVEAGGHRLNACALAVLGGRGPDAARWLREEPWPAMPLESDDWGERVRATVLHAWLMLVRNDGRRDLDAALECLAAMRKSQSPDQERYLAGVDPMFVKGCALELIGLYHLAKAAEVLARHMIDGAADEASRVRRTLEFHFRQVEGAFRTVRLLMLDPLSRLLAACASRMAGGPA